MEVTVQIRADSQVCQGIIGKVTLGPLIMLVYVVFGGAVHLKMTSIHGAVLFSKRKRGLSVIMTISVAVFPYAALKTNELMRRMTS